MKRFACMRIANICASVPVALKMMSCVIAVSISVMTVAQKSPFPIMGWSSWNTYRVNISDSLIMRQCTAR